MIIAWFAAHAIEALAIVLFGSWLLITILFQFTSTGWVRWAKSHDYFAMIPAWTFFAPNPGTTDVHLLYRDKLSDGKVLGWREVPFSAGALRGLWNPDKRLQKGVSDLGEELENYDAEYREYPARAWTHVEFIAVLNFVSRRPHAETAAFTQFAVARSYGRYTDRPTDVMFLSAFHRI